MAKQYKVVLVAAAALVVALVAMTCGDEQAEVVETVIEEVEPVEADAVEVEEES